MKILFIDDDEDAIAEACELLNDKMSESAIKTVEFRDAEKCLQGFQPDVVVLDLFLGSPSEQDAEGLKIEDFIWRNCFCPVIVYSADPSPFEKEHRLIKKVTKGYGSPQEVLRAVEEFKPVVIAIRESKVSLKREVDAVFSLVLRDVAEQAFTTFNKPEGLSDFIMRSGRRRLAAMMDTPLSGGLAGWEQYLCPPISEDVLLADVLMDGDGDKDDPESFRIVLTPSCDMVRANPKVDEVLVAKCCSMPDALVRVGLSGFKSADRVKKEILSQGYVRAIIPLPKLERLIPIMAANLRNLELIDIQEIGIEQEYKYQRIASCDSPFRELVAWAYMQNAARPGLPERDLNEWAEEIVKTHE